MMIRRSIRTFRCLLAASTFAISTAAVATDISTEPLNTYTATSSADVKPNVFFILDDSGSMDWDFMPDWACASMSTTNSSCSSTGQDPNSARNEYWFRNTAYNGIYYNPAVIYRPPIAVASNGTTNTTTYPSQTGTSTATGANESFTMPNWRSVKNDAYGIQSTSSTNIAASTSSPPYFFTTIAGEYCDSPALRNCITANAPSGNYTYPAKLRWCDSSDLTNCRAAFSDTFNYARSPSPTVATVTISNASSAIISGITVNGGKQIMAAATSASSTNSTVAQRIATQINTCTISISGNCTVSGYHAFALGSTVTIIAPGTETDTPVVAPGTSGSFNHTETAFGTNGIPGSVISTLITPDNNSYPYPGSATKAATRTDCAGATCTYTEEMTNYANWWTYYRTRMQMMKTAASNAFSTIDTATDITNGVSRFRLGFMTINNNNNADFVNLGEFAGTQKYNWYSKLIGANPSNSTPLRAALSKAGRLYAGKLDTLNGVTVSDPLQYSCQQNYTILSTDGFWNEGSGYKKMDGSTDVGNQDAALPRPYFDGASTTIQTRTSKLQSQTLTAQLQIRTNKLQTRITTLVSAPSIQQSTSTDYGSTWSPWANVSSCTPDSKGSDRTRCQYPKSTSTDYGNTWTSWSYASSCSTDTNGWSQTKCSGSITMVGSWTYTASCTPSSTTSSTTECRYEGWSAWANTDACTAQPPSSGSPYTVGTATECQTANVTGTWTDANSCTQSTSMNCRYLGPTSWSTVSSCTAVPASTGPNYTVPLARECQTIAGTGGSTNSLADVAAYYYNTDLRSSVAGDGTGTCDGPVISPATTPNDLCANNVPTNGRDVATYQHMTTFTLGLGAQGQMIYAPNDGKDYWNDTSGDFYDVLKGTTANQSTGICSWQTSGACNWPVPSSNSLKNIDDMWHAAINGHGAYFSATDPLSLASSLTRTLSTIINTPRPGTAAAAASSNPNVSASDNYVFSSSYKSVEWFGELIRQQITDAGALTAQNWSAMKLLDCATTPWQASTTYPVGSVYRQGTSCYSVVTEYTSGASFDTSDTSVDLLNTAVINMNETASPKVPVTAPTSRTIYTKSGTSLITFDWSSLVTASLDSYFTKPHIGYVSATQGLSQFCSSGVGCLSSTAQDNNTIADGGAAGEALVNFLRGDRTYENTYFRKRVHVLGDIVSAEARYVQAPLFNYNDANYKDFKTAKASRSGTVYVGANDGMLHAFEASSGKERWAYVPNLVIPDMYRLADKNYTTKHQYFVDGTPETGDICPNAPSSTCSAAEWKTILVGGLNRGGKGFYALDVTDPANPALLWEFTHADLGYSYGNPKITKLKDGTWVVLLASGYNNADGIGRLFVLNANTGALIRTISTDVGTADSPSGLARISAHVINPMTDNTTVAAYGGDTLGNLWRFDVNGDIGADGYDAHRLVSVTDGATPAKPQPITVKPLEATVNGKPIVYFGTGRFLGTTDVSSTQIQSFYAVKDNLDTVTLSNPRSADSNFVQQTLTATTCPDNAPTSVCTPGQVVRTSSSNAVDWNTKNGWYFDFLTGGERASSDPSLALGTLLFTTITPSSSSANACGSGTNTSASFAYSLNYLTGGAVDGAVNVSGVSLGSGLVTRPVMIEQADGTVRALIRTSGGSVEPGDGNTDMGDTKVITPPIKPTSSGGVRRVSWRELPTR